MDPLKEDDYREILRRELEHRSARNPRYSQRAFARDLGLRSGRLSEILAGKQGLSRRFASDIARRLGLPEEVETHFLDLVTLLHGRGRSERAQAKRRIQSRRRQVRYKLLAVDQFRLIADWPHLAILELSKLDAFEESTAWIARALGIPETHVEQALERLERLGYLRRGKGRWHFAVRDTFTPGQVPSEAIKQFHAQILAKASRALREQGVDRREFSTVLISTDRARLPEIKQRIREFWQSMDHDFGRASRKNAVYCLGIQCFDLEGSP